jgi:hypothetical protein
MLKVSAMSTIANRIRMNAVQRTNEPTDRTSARSWLMSEGVPISGPARNTRQ